MLAYIVASLPLAGSQPAYCSCGFIAVLLIMEQFLRLPCRLIIVTFDCRALCSIYLIRSSPNYTDVQFGKAQALAGFHAVILHHCHSLGHHANIIVVIDCGIMPTFIVSCGFMPTSLALYCSRLAVLSLDCSSMNSCNFYVDLQQYTAHRQQFFHNTAH